MSLRLLSTRAQIRSFFGDEPVLAATIRLTKACNLRCPHCYVNAGYALQDELSLEELKRVLDQLAKMKVFYLFYTGGEPFMRKDLGEILRYTQKKRIGISLSTNGLLLNKKVLEEIKNIPFDLFQISLDGTEKIHDSIRGKGSWRKAIKAIKLAKKILKKNVGVGTVITKRNWRVIDKVLYQGAVAGADTFTLLCLILTGRADESQNPTPKEFLKAIKIAFKAYNTLKNNLRIAKDTTVPPPLLPKIWRRRKIYLNFAPCSFPYYLGINANGDIAPCDGLFNHKEMIIGNIRETPLDELWQKSKLMKELRKIDPSDLKGVCRKCIYRDYCVGGCRAYAYIRYKDFTMPDPVCQMTYEAGVFPKECLK